VRARRARDRPPLLAATERVRFAQGWATGEELTAQIDRAKEVVPGLVEF